MSSNTSAGALHLQKDFPVPVPNGSTGAGKNDIYSHIYTKSVTFLVLHVSSCTVKNT